MSKNELSANAQKALDKARNGEKLDDKELQALKGNVDKPDLASDIKEAIEKILATYANEIAPTEAEIKEAEEQAADFGRGMLTDFFTHFNLSATLKDVGKLSGEEAIKATACYALDAGVKTVQGSIAKLLPEKSAAHKLFMAPLVQKVTYGILSHGISFIAMAIYRHTGETAPWLKLLARSGAFNTWDEVLKMLDVVGRIAKFNPLLGNLLNYREEKK